MDEQTPLAANKAWKNAPPTRLQERASHNSRRVKRNQAAPSPPKTFPFFYHYPTFIGPIGLPPNSHQSDLRQNLGRNKLRHQGFRATIRQVLASGAPMNHQISQSSVHKWSPASEYQTVVSSGSKFAGVRGRVLNALRAQPQSVSSQQVTEQTRKFQTMPMRSR